MARLALLLALAVLAAACGSEDDGATSNGSVQPGSPVPLQVTEVATGLDTVWALAWDEQGRLWYTERAGRLTMLGGESRRVEGASENGESGLMGLDIAADGRMFVMFTTAQDNRIVRLERDGSQRVLVEGIARASTHDGGRIRLGPDGQLYASTGDAARAEQAADPGSKNGKVLRIDPDSGRSSVFSTGHRNVQGLCFAADRRLYATEHGPTGNDEVNVLQQGFDGGWPATSGNGIKNYSPAVAPTGCTFYTADLIPQWRGSMLFTTLRGESLRRLTFASDGSVSAEEALYEGQYGRLRDVAVGPDGAVYLATSNRDGRGDPKPGDDKILKIAPPG